MDRLDNTDWDVIISGTGLKQSLLALALSRSGKTILHIDQNAYYGGAEAALSLSEAESWVQQHSGTKDKRFSHVEIDQTDDVGPSRSYSLALAPQLIFARSNLISALVSSGSHESLEFQAVGSWFVLELGSVEAGVGGIAGLRSVPGSREEVFQDTRLDLRTKRALMKFIRQSSLETIDSENHGTVSEYLEAQGIPASAHASVLALSLSPDSPETTSVATAVPNITRYLQSIGHLGPGFAAVIPKYGGLAEVAQVACRACAVGGGVYVLNRGIDNLSSVQTPDDGAVLSLSLGGEHVKTKWLVCDASQSQSSTTSQAWSRGVYIIKAALPALFPVTSEGGVTPAGAVVVVPEQGQPPVYLFVHSSDSGECPSGKYIVYANVKLPADTGFDRLQRAVRALAEPAWSMRFQQNTSHFDKMSCPSIVSFDDTGFDLALADTVLDEVKTVWLKITQEDEDAFMRFEPQAEEVDNE